MRRPTLPNLDRNECPRRVEDHEINLPFDRALSLRQDLPPVTSQPAGDHALRLAAREMPGVSHGSVGVGLEVVLVDERKVGELEIERQLGARQQHPDRGERATVPVAGTFAD